MREMDRSKLPSSDFSVHVAPRGFLEPLLEELGERVVTVSGRLVLAEGRGPAHWAQVSWLDPEWIEFTSIKEAARLLASQQRNWRSHQQQEGGLNRRMTLIEEALPHIARKPVIFGQKAPNAPMGAFTLWDANLMLAAKTTTSAFADGELHFEENKTDPPGRAYLKLWEGFTIFGVSPGPGDLCLDLGASPGSWSWVLGGLGCRVFSIDKAPLAGNVGSMPNVNHCLGSGFALDPRSVGTIDWLFSDMICYPSRLLTLVQDWMAAEAMRNAFCTLKFQSETDHETARAFAEIPGSKLVHLSCNRHELTWFWQKSQKK